MSLSWREAFDQIRPDLPTEQLQERILDCETAIFERLQELSQTDNSAQEHREIAEAMKKIREVQVEKLKYPEFGVREDVWRFGIPQT